MYMAVLILYSSSPKTLDEEIKYLADVQKKAVFGGYGVSDNPDIALLEMELVKILQGKNYGRMFLSIVISFSECESCILDDNKLELIAFEVCKILPNGYQVCYGIHFDNPTQKHIHFVINTVSCYDGVGKLDIDKRELIRIKRATSYVLMYFGLSPILSLDNRDLIEEYNRLH